MSEQISNLLSNCKKEEGVHLLSNYDDKSDFESTYISLRKKENRLYDDMVVSELPYSKIVDQKSEWAMRAKSAERVKQYFNEKEGNTLLDLGCGNGWFTSLLAKASNMEIIGMDINLNELKQAARLFQNENISFMYADIFQAQLHENQFDYITLNASVQYFKDFNQLINRLFEILKNDGEIHIIDSPIYESEEIANARIRTRNYYKEAGFEGMSEFYFHHSFDDLKNFSFQILYQPFKKSLLSKILMKKDIPFPWIKITKDCT